MEGVSTNDWQQEKCLDILRVAKCFQYGKMRQSQTRTQDAATPEGLSTFHELTSTGATLPAPCN